MKICFNEATTKDSSTLEKDISLCGKEGFEYIELRLDKIYEFLIARNIDDISLLLKDNNIKAHAINAYYTYPDMFKENNPNRVSELDHFVFSCSVAEKIGSGYLIVVPPLGDEGFCVNYPKSPEESENDFCAIVDKLSDIAKTFNVKLCLEPVGAPKSSIKTVSSMKKVLKALNKENVGVVLDAYNLYMAYMDSRFEEISLLDKDEILAVHMNNADSSGPSLEARRFCDEGIIDLSAFLREVKKTGYTGMASIETFRPEYWKKSPEFIIKKAYETTYEVLRRNGCISV